MTRLRLIVPCTKRKRLEAGALAMHDLVGKGWQCAEDLEARWWELAAQAARQCSAPAGDLYRGAQWPLVKQLRESTPAELHILSAGLGLLGEHDRVPGYDATFAGGAPDTVKLPGMPLSQARPAWWESLCRHRLPGQAGPRSLAALMAAHPQDSYLIVASPPYAAAIADDLAAGASHLADPAAQLLVVTSGNAAALPPSWVLSSHSGMRPALGGGLITLNMRLAARVATHFNREGHLGSAATAAVEALGARSARRVGDGH